MWLVTGRCSTSFEGRGTKRDSDLAHFYTRLLKEIEVVDISAVRGTIILCMSERTIQLLIATKEIFKALSRALCPLVCVSGCNGRLNQPGILSVSLLFVHYLPHLHLDLEPWIL